MDAYEWYGLLVRFGRNLSTPVRVSVQSAMPGRRIRIGKEE